MKRHIGSKIIIAVSIVAAFVIGIYALVTIRAQRDIMLGEMIRNSNQLSEVVRRSLHRDMLSNSRENILDIINTIGTEPGIKEARVVNKEGEVVYSSKSSDIGKLLDMEDESCYICHKANEPLVSLQMTERSRIYKLNPDSSSVMGIINPIYNQPSCYNADCHAHSKDRKVLGVLDIVVSLEAMEKQIIKSELSVLSFAFFALLTLGLVISFLINRLVTKPVNKLVKATTEIAAGNLNFRIELKHKDELGRLVDSFNEMTRKLSEARQQLFQSDKMASLGRLAAGVAHEINNPLTGVLTYSSFLMKRAQNNPELLEDLKVIVRETKRSREIVKGLLDFARQSAPKKVRADLYEILDRAIKVVENQLVLNHINLDKRYSDTLPQVTMDVNQMQQVFLNLLINASDAIGDKGGKISISTSLIKLDPKGITRMTKAVCPKGHDLIDNELKIGGFPSIKVAFKQSFTEGYINLDPVYGRYMHHFGKDFNSAESAEVSCSQCKTSLMPQGHQCPQCSRPMVVLAIPGEGNVEICLNTKYNYERWEKVDLTGERDFLQIEISDSGPGIPEENLEKIFEPFFTTKGQKGTGLGLAVIWGIIDNHGGTITVDSAAGKGTTFKVRIPVN